MYTSGMLFAYLMKYRSLKMRFTGKFNLIAAINFVVDLYL